MNSKKKFILSVFVLFAFITNIASASILGSDLIKSSSLIMASGATYHSNQFYSDQEGVHEQTEHYFEYTPNTNTVPVIASGDKIFGRKTILEAAEYMKKQGLYPLMGINADYFSLQTGVPMGHTIVDGKILTKDVTGQDAIGFNEDGTAFLSWLEICTMMDVGGQTIYIDNINKYRQPYAIYMFTDDFSDTTQNTTPGLDIILGSVKGELKLGESITAVVEEVAHHDGAISIPKGKIVLSIDDAGFADLYSQMSAVQVGQTVKITNLAAGDAERWNKAKYAIGSIGGRLLTNGVVNSDLEKGAAPRTAIGIKPDGSIIFYTIDGRQDGYSYGVQLTTLAKRLLELGCSDALNLDGGGSTSITGIYPGYNVMSVLNSPSDGALRKCANFIFLKNTQKPTGELNSIQLYPYYGYYLSGATQQMQAFGLDKSYYPCAITDSPNYSIAGGKSTITSDGLATIKGTGDITVTAVSKNAKGSVTLKSVENPTKILLYNEDTSQELSSIQMAIGESIDLKAAAYSGRTMLTSSDNCYKWEIEGNIGTINSEGIFTASNNAGAVGKIKVSAGSTMKSVDVSIANIDESLKYPQIEIYFENNEISAVAKSTGSAISAKNINLKIDGYQISDANAHTLTETINLDDISSDNLDEEEQSNIEKKHSNLTVRKEQGENKVSIFCKVGETFENSPHKVTVTATNDLGYSNTAYFTVIGKNSLENPFSDTSNHWAKNIISYMYFYEVIKGETINQKLCFRPDDAMTRAEFAVMISNALKINTSNYSDKTLSFADAKSIPSWAENQIKAMVNLKIINGKQNGSKLIFDPNAKITRAEAMTIIGRILPSGMQSQETTFADDSQIPNWAVQNIGILYKLGAIGGYEDGTIRPNNTVTKAEALKMLFYVY
ncbi:MAG: S-layer homology domain-containing protein [Clostridia bacterium]|nr:S-layer homology domain-containing protein [Clostridia bacterium]